MHCNRRCSSTEERRPVTSEAAGSAPASGAFSLLQVVKWTIIRVYEARVLGSTPSLEACSSAADLPPGLRNLVATFDSW